jgi:hypothetical protein
VYTLTDLKQLLCKPVPQNIGLQNSEMLTKRSFVESLTILQKLVCTNQSELVQYTFLASEKHKQVKNLLSQLIDLDIYKTKSQFSGLSAQKLKDELKSSLNELDEYLYFKFAEIFQINYKYILSFFKERSNLPPRACLKVIVGNQLVTLFRTPYNLVADLQINPDENTAFKKIASGDKFYYSNNIPEEIESENYTNPRIDRQKVIEYNKLMKESSGLQSPEDDQVAWANCWKPVALLNGSDEIEPPIETCYKSTFVMPLSLDSRTLQDKFLQHFKVKPGLERLIFGFLCLDHGTVDFFEKDVDSAFINIMADILSQYLIQQLTFTQYSASYYKAKHYSE